MKPPAIWITGGGGFIGRHLSMRLAESGRRVVGLGHGAWPEAGRFGVDRWLNGEVSAENLSELAHDEGGPDTVFHLAGGSSVGAAIAAPREDFKRTVEATASLCEWLRLEAPEARLLAVSSAAVYGAGHEGRIHEDAATRPYSPYGFHKLMMEQICRSYADSYGLQIVIARLFSVYGPGLRKQLLWDVCRRLAGSGEALDLGGTGGELRDWTDVRDVVCALDLISRMASTDAPVINVGSGTGTDVATIAHQLMAALGADRPVRFSGVGRSGDPASLVADNRRLAALGFEWTMPVEQGLQDYARWWKAEG